MKKKTKYNVCVVGAGVVGVEMLRVLKQRKFPVGKLRVLARSSRKIIVDGQAYEVEKISPNGFSGIDFALFAGTEGEKGAAVTYASEAIKKGAVVIDNGADFRMQKDVPLVVPEVNGADAKKNKGIIANPNCSTIQMVVAIAPIHKKVKIKRVIVTTFQAASGAGRGALQQLWEETKKMVTSFDLSSASVKPVLPLEKNVEKALPHQIAFNAFPHIGAFKDFDYTTEEWKMVKETHKIMHTDKIKITATCVRVPALNSHAEAIYLETEKYIAPEKVKELLAASKGIIVIDKPQEAKYPMPVEVSSRDEVFVGRIRKDPFVKNGLWLWVVSDNLRKGAATNAIQIAEYLIDKF